VHLRSNLITRGNKEAETARNIQKREVAVTQLIAHVHDVIETTKLAIKGIVIGGDFNTNHDQEMFEAEKTLDSIIGAGYQNGFEELPLERRVTHPANHGFPNATFDYVFLSSPYKRAGQWVSVVVSTSSLLALTPRGAALKLCCSFAASQ